LQMSDAPIEVSERKTSDAPAGYEPVYSFVHCLCGNPF